MQIFAIIYIYTFISFRMTDRKRAQRQTGIAGNSVKINFCTIFFVAFKNAGYSIFFQNMFLQIVGRIRKNNKVVIAKMISAKHRSFRRKPVFSADGFNPLVQRFLVFVRKSIKIKRNNSLLWKIYSETNKVKFITITRSSLNQVQSSSYM